MAVPFTKEQIKPLAAFLEIVKLYPAYLHKPELAFLKSFLEHFGGKVPDNEKTPDRPSFHSEPNVEEQPRHETTKNEPKPEPESEESDLELDMSAVVEPDTDAPQKMGNPTLIPTEEEIAESQAKRSDAVSAFVEKDYEKAVALYTEAIVLNPQAALLYSKRGQIYMLMQKPNACIRDCNRALELNPDSAAAHKFRGRANYLLGRFEEAAADLRLACKFDFDEQADEWLREVTPNARKIEEHMRKKDRRATEKKEKERAAAFKKSKEEAKTRDDNSRPSQTEEPPAAAGGGGAAEMGDFSQFVSDPEVLQLLQDPEVSAAILDISANPVNILKYQTNPKVMAWITKAASTFGGAGGAGAAAGGMPAGFPGMMSGMAGGMPGGGFFGGAGTTPNEPPSTGPKPSAPNPDDDVGLD